MQRCHRSHCFSVGGNVATRPRLPPFHFGCHHLRWLLATSLRPCHLPPPCNVAFYATRSRLPPFHFGYHLRWLFATFVQPCHLPPPCNVATHPTVSQWVASLPLVRACHLSFPYQDISDDSTTLPPSTSMQRCHPSAHGNSRWIKPAPPCTSLLSDCAACLCAPQACGPTLRISDGT